MKLRAARNLAFAALFTAVPCLAMAAGSGTGGVGGGVGAAGTGSAAVGGGAPAGRVGGGPPAGAVGGGAPGSMDPAGNGAAGTGNPGANAAGVTNGTAGTPAAGLENAPTTGGVIGGHTGAPPDTASGSTAPPITGQIQPDPIAPKSVEGVAEQAPSATVGLATPGPDGVSTVIVAPRPCGVAAHETDGTTTCVGLPARTH